MLAWFSVITALLNWLSETPAQKQSSSTPGYLSVGMAGRGNLTWATVEKLANVKS
jgi:hypothetical protein